MEGLASSFDGMFGSDDNESQSGSEPLGRQMHADHRAYAHVRVGRPPQSTSDGFRDQISRRLAIGEGGDSDMLSADGVLIQGDGNEQGERISGQWEYRSFDEEIWDGIVEEHTDDPDYCFLCACTQTDKEMEGNPNVRRFREFCYNSYGDMTRKALALQAQGVYNSLLRAHTKHKKPMRCTTIIDHVERHAPNERIQLEQMTRVLNCCLMEEATKLRQVEKGTAQTRLSKPNINQYIKLATFLNEVTGKLRKIRSESKK